MAKKDNELTQIARAAYDGGAASYLATSAAWYAHHLGVHLYVTGRAAPTDVRMSRGSKIRSGGLVFEHVGTCARGIGSASKKNGVS